jgi:hypothetical protein
VGTFASPRPLPDPARARDDGAKELRVLAARDLRTLGDAPKAHAFLEAMLDDVVHIRNGEITGVEALADLHRIPFRWGKSDHLRRVRRR